MPSSTQSPTTNTTTDTTTTTTSPPPTTPSEPSTTPSLAETPSKPFRLLDLPFELVSQILEHSIEGISSETEPIEIAFSSSFSSFSSITTTTPIIEEIEEEEGEKTTREEKGEEIEKESISVDVGINSDIIEMKYPPYHNTKEETPHPHPGIFQTCRILRSEGPSIPKKPPAKTPNINLLLFLLFYI